MKRELYQIQAVRERWARHRIMCRSRCLKCNRRLGIRGIVLANHRFSVEAWDLQSRSAGLALRLFRVVYAICPECGNEHGFDPKKRTLTAQKE